MAQIFKRMEISKRTGTRHEGRFWWIRYTQYHRQEKRSLGVTDRRLALMMKAQIERNIERGKAGLPQSYVDAYELFEEYKASVIKKKSPAYQKRMFQLLKPFLLYVQVSHHLNLARLSVRDIENHLHARRPHLSARSWNDEVREIRRFINFAIDREYLTQNPAAKIPLMKVIVYSVEIFSPAELDLIFKFAYPPYLPFYKLLLFTGVRDGEARHLRWEDVDLTPGFEHIKIRNTSVHLTKTRKDRAVPLSEEAVAMLQEMYSKRNLRNPYVFPGRCGGCRANNRNTWMSCMRRIEKSTGVKINRGCHRSGLHLFRHTFASYALASGVDIRTVQQWLGHASIVMTQRYTNLLPDQSRSQIQKLQYFARNQ